MNHHNISIKENAIFTLPVNKSASQFFFYFYFTNSDGEIISGNIATTIDISFNVIGSGNKDGNGDIINTKLIQISDFPLTPSSSESLTSKLLVTDNLHITVGTLQASEILHVNVHQT